MAKLEVDPHLEKYQKWYKARESVRYKKGHVKSQGERNSQAKLTWEQVKEIRALYESGETGAYISKLYKVAPNTISQILSKQRWNYTDEDFKDGKENSQVE